MSLVPGVGAGMQFASGLNQFMETGDPTGLILSAAGFVAMVNPCGLVAKGLSAYYAVSSALEFAANPTDPMAGLHILGVIGGVAGMFSSCFTGDMLVDVEGGKKRAEEIVEGDRIWSRHEDEPDGPLSLKAVEEVFVRVSPILNVYVAGQVLRTTGEHPFWVENRGDGGTWLAARDMSAGDWLRTRDGSRSSRWRASRTRHGGDGVQLACLGLPYVLRQRYCGRGEFMGA